MSDASVAHDALRAAGYRSYGVQEGGLGRGQTLWQRRTPEGRHVNVEAWPPIGTMREWRFEVDAYAHDDRDAAHVKLYSYSADALAARLPELERRVLAALAALEIRGEDDDGE